MRRILRHDGHFLALAMSMLVALASFTLPIGHTLWSEVLGVAGSVTTEEQLEGTSLDVANRTTTAPIGLSSIKAASSTTASGEICVTNRGDIPTQDLTILVQVESAVSETLYQSVDTAAQSFIPNRQLSPGESGCFPYSIEFSPAAGVQYRSSVYVTITNYAGWLPPSENCPGPGACPYGPSASTSLLLDGLNAPVKELEQTPVPSPTTAANQGTSIEARLDTSTNRVGDIVEANSVLVVKNTGSLPAEGVVAYAQVFAANEESDPVRAASDEWEWRSDTALQPGDEINLPFPRTFTPVTGERYIIQARVRITNHAGWQNGSENCPGTEACPFGPTIRMWLVFPENTPESSFTPTRTATFTFTPTVTATLLLTHTPTLTFTPIPTSTVAPPLNLPTSAPSITPEDTAVPTPTTPPLPTDTDTPMEPGPQPSEVPPG